MKKYALIVAGGVGRRMGSDTPKQFLPIAGQPILMHTISAFYQFDHTIEIVVVLPHSHFNDWTKLCMDYDFDISHRMVGGGSTRFHSVQNGLETMEEEGLVAIHDGVRPIIDNELISRCFDEAVKHSSAIAAVKLKDSIRKVTGEATESRDRSLYWAIQTPQTFALDQIKSAYSINYEETITDDASVFELSGRNVHLVEGSYKNIKITTEEDILIAETFLKGML